VLDTTLGELEKGQVSTHRSILLRCGTKFTPVVAILRRLELTERRADRVTERTRRWTDQSANGLPSRGRAGNVPSLRPTARAATTAIPAPIMRFMSLPSKGKVFLHRAPCHPRVPDNQLLLGLDFGTGTPKARVDLPSPSIDTSCQGSSCPKPEL